MTALPIPGIHGNHPTTEWLHEAARAATSVHAPTPPREWPTPQRAPRPDQPATQRPAWQREALDALALAREQARSETPDVDETIRLLRVAAAAVKQSRPVPAGGHDR